MHVAPGKASALALVGFAAAATTALLPSAAARPAGGRDVLDSLVGTWSGSASIVSGSGESQSIPCRATYSGGSAGLQQTLMCAGPSLRIDVSGTIQQQGDRVSGRWRETTLGFGGSVDGTVSGNRITTTLTGLGFSAALSIALHGDRHTVSITPSAGDIRSVSVSFRR